MTAERCGACRFWDRAEKECRRHAPVPFPMPQANVLTGQAEIAVLGLRPPTPGSGWCGDFAARVLA